VLGLIISAIVVGLIIGALGRLVLPGRQDMPIWLTILIGIVAALIGRSSPARSVLAIPAGSTGSSSSSRWPWPRLGWPWSPADTRLEEDAYRARAWLSRRESTTGSPSGLLGSTSTC
jgi:uncharacterized membrane protein YeaQ/YmgE (transglycosylase-associated protein family)